MKTVLVFIIGNFYNALSYISKNYAANKALQLFTTPRKGSITKMQSAFLDTAIKEELSYNGLPIMTYKWLGNNATVLLVHGWESNTARWKLLINNLRGKDFNIIALDAPAHGLSGGKEFSAVLYSEFINVVAKKFTPQIIIGHSVGGMATVFYLQKYQNTHLKKLILLGAPSEFIDILKRYTSMLRYNKRVKTQLNTVIVERFGKTPEEFSTATFIKDIAIEGLIIHDKLDSVIPYEDALLIDKSYENGNLITTNGFGHSLNNTSVSNHILEFINN